MNDNNFFLFNTPEGNEEEENYQIINNYETVIEKNEKIYLLEIIESKTNEEKELIIFKIEYEIKYLSLKKKFKSEYNFNDLVKNQLLKDCLNIDELFNKLIFYMNFDNNEISIEDDINLLKLNIKLNNLFEAPSISIVINEIDYNQKFFNNIFIKNLINLNQKFENIYQENINLKNEINTLNKKVEILSEKNKKFEKNYYEIIENSINFFDFFSEYNENKNDEKIDEKKEEKTDEKKKEKNENNNENNIEKNIFKINYLSEILNESNSSYDLYNYGKNSETNKIIIDFKNFDCLKENKISYFLNTFFYFRKNIKIILIFLNFKNNNEKHYSILKLFKKLLNVIKKNIFLIKFSKCDSIIINKILSKNILNLNYSKITKIEIIDSNLLEIKENIFNEITNLKTIKLIKNKINSNFYNQLSNLINNNKKLENFYFILSNIDNFNLKIEKEFLINLKNKSIILFKYDFLFSNQENFNILFDLYYNSKIKRFTIYNCYEKNDFKNLKKIDKKLIIFKYENNNSKLIIENNKKIIFFNNFLIKNEQPKFLCDKLIIDIFNLKIKDKIYNNFYQLLMNISQNYLFYNEIKEIEIKISKELEFENYLIEEKIEKKFIFNNVENLIIKKLVFGKLIVKEYNIEINKNKFILDEFLILFPKCKFIKFVNFSLDCLKEILSIPRDFDKKNLNTIYFDFEINNEMIQKTFKKIGIKLKKI